MYIDTNIHTRYSNITHTKYIIYMRLLTIWGPNSSVMLLLAYTIVPVMSTTRQNPWNDWENPNDSGSTKSNYVVNTHPHIINIHMYVFHTYLCMYIHVDASKHMYVYTCM